MIIAGYTTDGLKQWITPAGERVEQCVGRVQKIYVGVAVGEFFAKRVWVDEGLTDFECCVFLKTVFSEQAFYSMDYETIERDSGRVLLHAFALHQPVLQKKVTAIETNLHGLGRALDMLFQPLCAFQCVSIYMDHILLSVHRDACVYYFTQEFFSDYSSIVHAMRIVMERYYAAEPLEISRCFYMNFSGKREFEYDSTHPFDAPVTCVNSEWLKWLIPYGLACRGIQRD